ncbi:MAG TPA: SpoIIIAH-like family protein [Candidatus Blautia gallistercoris]|uniref:SpoIIIAH-like family protein n=1 Tax=Candidatus Blautia gallistercoris TaxID=2838490 RepID=A0A9D2B2S7_9FIRM|nr:SpoIIIAH-like family protein [Candidatus Blautia gallistercoris]
MKKVIKKNQVVITALAALIAVAGYLNFADVDLGTGDKEASAEGTTIVEDIESLDYDLSDETAVLSENTEEETGETGDMEGTQNETDTQSGETADAGEELDPASGTPGEAVLTGSSNFAAQARINREQIRSQNKASLQEIIDNAELSQEQKAEAVSSMVEMTEMVEKEAAAELLLEAKGFQDVVVNLTGETADVVVPDSSVDDASRAQIEDIVQRKTGIAPENIVISPMSETE